MVQGSYLPRVRCYLRMTQLTRPQLLRTSLLSLCPHTSPEDWCIFNRDSTGSPWVRSNYGFIMLFKAFAMALIEEDTPVNSVAKTLKEYPNRIWTIFRHWMGKGKRNLNLSWVRRIGVDETSRRKSHSYITQFVDLDTRQTIFVCPGMDSDTFREFLEWL